MSTPPSPESLVDLVARALDERIALQEARVLSRARELVPHLTCEDIRNPDDWPELQADGRFNYELGTLEGYCGARLAVIAACRTAGRSDTRG